ncbi:unnamed protein product [Amoebophrya sp. A25]|nr:unnamed protein product [Amoebophrya sp. A25]|eukprot:GSA25T00021281001.1
MGTMREMVAGIQQVKYLTWEENYLQLLFQKRKEELWEFDIVLMIISTLPVHAYTNFRALTSNPRGDQLTAANVFATITAYMSLRLPIASLPNCVNSIFTWKVIVQRLDSYLQQKPDQEEMTFHSTDGAETPLGVKDSTAEQPQVLVKVVDGCGSFLLRDLNFEVKQGQLVAVVGSTGCGKTSLLLSLIGSMVRRKGKAVRPSGSFRIGYAPQKPFVLSGTIRDNILMGRSRQDDGQHGQDTSSFLDKAVEKSQLSDDISRGDWNWETEIGERGTTLSGGQQQRLALARAVYGNPDFLVIDDALSAVDGHVANAIFGRVFAGRPTGQTIIIALNQLHFLPRCDHILFLEKGRISAQGSLQELLLQALILNEGFRRFYFDNTTEEKEADGSSSTQKPDLADTDLAYAATTTAAAPTDSATTKPETATNTDPISDEANPDTKNVLTTSKGVFGKEMAQTGGLSTFQTLRPFFNSLGRYTYVVKMFTIATLCYAAMTMTDFWLSDWVTSAEKSATNREQDSYSETERILIHIGLTTLYLFGLFSLSLFNAVAMNRACRQIHDNAATIKASSAFLVFSIVNQLVLDTNIQDKISRNTPASKPTVMHATYSWFEQTPSGRILSRFGADLSAVDHFLLAFSDDMCHFVFAVGALVVIIAIVVPIFLRIATGERKFQTERELIRRLKKSFSLNKNKLSLKHSLVNILSSLYNAFSVLYICRSLPHSVLIAARPHRASNGPMHLQKFFQTRMAELLAEFLRYRYFTETVTHAGFLWASLAAYAISIAAAIVMLRLLKIKILGVQILDGPSAPIGLALSYSFILPYFFSLLILLACYTVNMMVSLERVLELQNAEFVPQDPPWYTKDSVARTSGGASSIEAPSTTKGETEDTTLKPSPKKNQSVHIEFSNVCLRYRPHLSLSLESVNLKFLRGSKTGIIGRTGAGKSSLLVALFRLVEIDDYSKAHEPSSSSCIKIDGMDTRKMGLQELRRQITVIPQQTLLLEGTLARNLDPFGEHEEEELTRILEEVGLHESLNYGTLQVRDMLHIYGNGCGCVL